MIRILAQDLRRLKAANGGEPTAFDRLLDIAYGRVGKLRQELMEVSMSTPMSTSSSLTMPTSLYSRIRILRSSPRQTHGRKSSIHLFTLRNSPLSSLQAFRAPQGHCKCITLSPPRVCRDEQHRILKTQCFWDHQVGVANTTSGGVSSNANGRRCTLLCKYRCNIPQINLARAFSQITHSTSVLSIPPPSRSCLR